jgi:hypothetical protein
MIIDVNDVGAMLTSWLVIFWQSRLNGWPQRPKINGSTAEEEAISTNAGMLYVLRSAPCQTLYGRHG